MKKKWELIKEAYDRYPAGACFNLMGESDAQLSSGKFDFNGDDIYDIENKVWVYYLGKWATIVEPEQKPDLLDGKVAIRVNDEQEFKALMKHYEEKGWVAFPNTKPSEFRCEWITSLPYFSTYCNQFETTFDTTFLPNYKIVDFPDFAAHVGIEVRKPLLRSEDNVDLFEGSGYFLVRKDIFNQWNCQPMTVRELHKEDVVIKNPEVYKAFTNSEAAEAFCAEQNRPKEIVLFENRPSCPTVVLTSNGLYRKDPDGDDDVHIFVPDELEQIYAAYQKVKGGEHGA